MPVYCLRKTYAFVEHFLVRYSYYDFYQVGDLGYASELGNYAEYSGAPNEEEVLQYARIVLDVRSIRIFSPPISFLFYIFMVSRA